MQLLDLDSRRNARDFAIITRAPLIGRATTKAPRSHHVGLVIRIARLSTCFAINAHNGRGDDEIGQSGHLAMALNAR